MKRVELKERLRLGKVEEGEDLRSGPKHKLLMHRREGADGCCRVPAEEDFT